MSHPEYTYKIVYKDANQVSHAIAEVYLTDDDRVEVKYLKNSQTVFPSLDPESTLSSIEPLWYRIPAPIRRQEKNKRRAFDSFVQSFSGRLSTDRFEFLRV